MIVVVRPEIPALLVERFDMGLQRGQSERVERQHVLSVFGLAIRLDDPAIYDDAGYLDRKSPSVQVEQVTTGAHVDWADSKSLNEWERKALELSEERSQLPVVRR
jgi:hypothetical protein